MQSLKGFIVFLEKHCSDSICHICPLAKQRRLNFPANNHRSEHIFDLVHADIWGPFKTATHAGYTHFLTIVDDFSRYTWVYLLRNKSDVVHIIPRYFQLVETQFLKTIKCFRSDNAPELKFEDYFAEKSVLHQLSCPYTPQQNSVVERKHQHLLNVAHALMFQSHIPHIFWGECILTAAHLINRTPMSLLSEKTPFYTLFGREADYSLLKVFGCLAYASTIAVQRSKFDPRATPCVFMGYPVGVKGYKLYDVAKCKFFISRDVLFFEDLFHFQSIQNTDFTTNVAYLDNFVLPIDATDVVSIHRAVAAPSLSDRHETDLHEVMDVPDNLAPGGHDLATDSP